MRESASQEEVRAAYLQKAKEIHPDKVPEGVEREDAERRMTRLNEVMEVLGVEDRRAGYDGELRRQRNIEEAGLRKVAIAASLQVWKGSQGGPAWKAWWAYGGVGLVCIVIGWVAAVLLSDSRETQWWQVQSNRPAEAAAPEGKTKPEVAAPRRVERAASDAAAVPLPRVAGAMGPKASAQRGPDLNAVNPLVEEARSALLRKPEAVPVLPRAARAVPAPVPVAAAEVPRPAAVEKAAPVANVASNVASNVAWEGAWKYQPSLGGGIGGSFSPVSIMVQMHTSGQKVRGLYRGKYQVDRRYAAQVEFSFEGWADNPEILNGVWHDSSGARGEFALKKVEARVMEMNWWTTAFARKGALAAGAARLVEFR